jgi:hypothetical protein
MSDLYSVDLACGHAIRRMIRGGIVKPSYRCWRCKVEEVVLRYFRITP